MLETTKPHNSHVCPHQFAFMLDNWVRKLFQNPSKILRDHVNPGDTAVDIGCGPGFFTIDLAKLVGESGQVIAVDLQEKMLARVSKKAARRGVAGRIGCHRCEADRIGLDQKADFILGLLHGT